MHTHVNIYFFLEKQYKIVHEFQCEMTNFNFSASRRQKMHETETLAESMSEKKAIQLIMEELILDV